MHPAGIKKGQTVRHYTWRGIEGTVKAVYPERKTADAEWKFAHGKVEIEETPFSELVRREKAVA